MSHLGVPMTNQGGSYEQSMVSYEQSMGSYEQSRVSYEQSRGVL